MSRIVIATKWRCSLLRNDRREEAKHEEVGVRNGTGSGGTREKCCLKSEIKLTGSFMIWPDRKEDAVCACGPQAQTCSRNSAQLKLGCATWRAVSHRSTNTTEPPQNVANIITNDYFNLVSVSSDFIFKLKNLPVQHTVKMSIIRAIQHKTKRCGQQASLSSSSRLLFGLCPATCACVLFFDSGLLHTKPLNMLGICEHSQQTTAHQA